LSEFCGSKSKNIALGQKAKPSSVLVRHGLAKGGGQGAPGLERLDMVSTPVLGRQKLRPAPQAAQHH
jgi:hypothetical protein